MRLWFLVTALTLSLPSAWPCTCLSDLSPTEAWQEAQLIALGRIGHTTPTVQLRVETIFKGPATIGSITLQRSPDSCAPTLAAGTRMLLYLHRNAHAGTWFVRGCTRSANAESAVDDLLFLRALPASATRTRISGRVTTRTGPAKGIRVLVFSETHVVETRTSLDGVYEVYDLPPGTYTVGLAVPPEIAAFAAGDYQVRLRPKGGASVDFTLEPARAGAPLSGLPALDPK